MADSSVYIDVNMDVSRAEKNWAKFVKKIEDGKDRLTEIDYLMDAIKKDSKLGDLDDDALKRYLALEREAEGIMETTQAWQKLADALERYYTVKKKGIGFDASSENKEYADNNIDGRGGGRLVRGSAGAKGVVPTNGMKEMFDVESLVPYWQERMHTMFQNIVMYAQEAGQGIKLGLSAMGEALPVVINRFDSALKNGLRGTIGIVGELSSAIRGGLGNAIGSLRERISNAVHKPFDDFKTLILRNEEMMKNAFMFNVIAKSWREVSSYAQQVFAKNQQISQELGRMKGAIYSLIQPLVSAIIPILSRIISFITSILVSIGKLVSMLTGKSWSASVAGAKSVASSMGSGAKSAKEMKKFLASFDEINQLGTKDEDTDVGGGGGGVADIAPLFDFSKIKDIDWGKLFDDIHEKMRKWIDFLENYDWQGLGKRIYDKLKEVFGSINWVRLLEDSMELLGAGIGALAGLVWGFLKSMWDDVVAYFKPYIEAGMKTAGGNVVLGFLMGIVNGLGNIAVWIWNHMFVPFINGFKKAFGISSPSTVMEEMGHYVVEGFYNGLLNMWERISGIIQNVVQAIKNAFTSAWEFLKSFGNWLASGFISIVSSAFEGIKTIFSNVVTFISERISSAKELLSGLTQFISGIFASGWSGAWQKVKDAFKGVMNGIIDSAESAVNYVIRAINNIGFNVPDWVPKLGGKHFGLSIPPVTLPRLATGAVIPANSPFLAMLGDQKSGTNIEAPLDTIVQAFRMALNERNTRQEAVMVVDRTVFARLVYDLMNEEGKRIGVDLVQ